MRQKKEKEISIALELTYEPIAIETMLPKQTLVVHRGMLILCTFRRRAIDAVTIVSLDLDDRRVVVLGVGSSAESTAHALRATLVGMMTPLLAPSALKGAGVWFCSDDLTREIAKVNELTNEGSRIGATHGVVNIDPCRARVRVG
jgi:hypothetical protein